MSIIVTIETDLGKVAHAFTTGAAKLKAALLWAAGEEQKIAPEIAAVESVANSVIGQIYPGADKVALAIETLMANGLAAVESLGAAAGAAGMSVQLDAAAVHALKDALPIVTAQAATTPGA